MLAGAGTRTEAGTDAGSGSDDFVEKVDEFAWRG